METEERILSAAREVILERGVDGARMEEIAHRARVNKALLHYYFGSKEGLCREILRRAMRELVARLSAEVAADLPFPAALERFVSQYLDFVAANRRLAHLVLWELGRGGEELAEVFRDAFRDGGQPENPLVALFRRASERGEIRPVDPVHAALSLVGACLFPILARDIVPIIACTEFPLETDFLEERKRHILDVFWNGLRPEVRCCQREAVP